jgi:hypothetical protein
LAIFEADKKFGRTQISRKSCALLERFLKQLSSYSICTEYLLDVGTWGKVTEGAECTSQRVGKN